MNIIAYNYKHLFLVFFVFMKTIIIDRNPSLVNLLSAWPQEGKSSNSMVWVFLANSCNGSCGLRVQQVANRIYVKGL